MSINKKLVKYGNKEITFIMFFGILSIILFIFTFKIKAIFLKVIGGLITLASLGFTIFTLISLNKKRKIIKNMEVIEANKKYESYSKLYFILNNFVFPDVIEEIDGSKSLFGIDEMGIFAYIEDKKLDRQGHLPSTKIKFNKKNLNTTFKTLKYERHIGDDLRELKFTFREPKSRYLLSFDVRDNGFIFQRME